MSPFHPRPFCPSQESSLQVARRNGVRSHSPPNSFTIRLRLLLSSQRGFTRYRMFSTPPTPPHLLQAPPTTTPATYLDSKIELPTRRYVGMLACQRRLSPLASLLLVAHFSSYRRPSTRTAHDSRGFMREARSCSCTGCQGQEEQGRSRGSTSRRVGGRTRGYRSVACRFEAHRVLAD